MMCWVLNSPTVLRNFRTKYQTFWLTVIKSMLFKVASTLAFMAAHNDLYITAAVGDVILLGMSDLRHIPAWWWFGRWINSIASERTIINNGSDAIFVVDEPRLRGAEVARQPRAIAPGQAGRRRSDDVGDALTDRLLRLAGYIVLRRANDDVLAISVLVMSAEGSHYPPFGCRL